jgi:opacity protein-like surface antigen
MINPNYKEKTMIKKLAFATVSVAVISAASSANAVEIKPYLSGNLRYVFENKDDGKYKDAALSNQNSTTTFDAGAGYGIAGGAIINNTFRAELELSQQKTDLKKNNVYNYTTGEGKTLAVMANGYYDFKNSSQFTPYVGAGIGGIKLSLENPGVNDDDTVFAYQGMAGVGYDINQSNTISLGYRYFATADATFTDRLGDPKFPRKWAL